jgi:hypothetical protein
MRPGVTRGSRRKSRFIFCPAFDEIIHCGSRPISYGSLALLWYFSSAMSWRFADFSTFF